MYDHFCKVPGNQCILHAGIPGEIDPEHVIFKYRKYVKTEELRTILQKQIEKSNQSRVINDLCNHEYLSSENNPYGYLQLNLDTGFSGLFKGTYLIVKTKSDTIPDLFKLIDRVPYHTPTPQFFNKVGGGRRRTRSQKKRRSTRRRN